MRLAIDSYLSCMQCIYLAILTKVKDFTHLWWLWCSYFDLTRRWLGRVSSSVELVGQIMSRLCDIRLLINKAIIRFSSI